MTIRWFKDSPDAGHPDCLCSWCGKVIPAADAPVIRMFNDDTDEEARFHRRCAAPALGLMMPEVSYDEGEDWPWEDP